MSKADDFAMSGGHGTVALPTGGKSVIVVTAFDDGSFHVGYGDGTSASDVEGLLTEAAATMGSDDGGSYANVPKSSVAEA